MWEHVGLRKKATKSFRTVTGIGQRLANWPGLFNIELNAAVALILREVLLHGMAVNNLTSRGAINLKRVSTALINHEYNTQERQI